MKRLVQKYNKSGDIAKLAHAILHVFHVFEDGNGRLARLLIYWHCRRRYNEEVIFRYNARATRRWRRAVTSPTSDRLHSLICIERKLCPTQSAELHGTNNKLPPDDTSDTTTTSTTTIPDTCGFCITGMVDCCDCPWVKEYWRSGGRVVPQWLIK